MLEVFQKGGMTSTPPRRPPDGGPLQGHQGRAYPGQGRQLRAGLRGQGETLLEYARNNYGIVDFT